MIINLLTENSLNIFIKLIQTNLCLCYIFFKILKYSNIKKIQQTLLIITAIILAFIGTVLKLYTSNILISVLICFIYTFILKIFVKDKISNTFSVVIISAAISYIGFTVSAFIVFTSITILNILYYDSPICSIIIAATEFFLVYILFRIKKLKDGFQFVRNKSQIDYIDIFIQIISIILIFLYFYIGNYNNLTLPYLFTGLLLFVLIAIPLLQKSFNIYHKQKLQTQALKDYEKELSETKQKLETAIEEKQKLVKSNHEFYHRQEALSKKLNDLIRLHSISDNTEFAAELSNIQDRIQNLSSEYLNKTRTISQLVKTNIEELDDMLSYMQSECNQNNIEFILKINCDINHILENFITKSQLETLLGDLIRNAIIAINHSSNEYRSILVVFGIKEDSYELCILDSGIPFEIETLINLGLQPASTHINEGGTGIGFVTTFETINSCNASFIINENTNSNYSKSLEIKFDNKHEYVIISERKDKIKEMNLSNREIILK